MNNVKIIETGNRFGNMNAAKAFYPDGYTQEERLKDFLNRRMLVGKMYGFDGHKMFMAIQETKTGTYFEITKDYVGANPNGWSDILEDILIITDKTPGVVIGHPVADCPVVMMSDPKKGVSAIAHCSAELIDKKMPMMVADALMQAYGSKDEDIIAYVSACAGPNWTYDTYPKWVTDKEMWKSGIEADKNGIFHINIRKVMLEQLKDRNISLENITFNSDDTITHSGYYSNSASSPYGLNDPIKKGRNFAGLFYEDSEFSQNNKKTR